MEAVKKEMDNSLIKVYNRMSSAKIMSSMLLTGVVASFIYVSFFAPRLYPLRWYLTGGALLAYVAYFAFSNVVFAILSKDRDLSTYDSFVIASALSTALRNGETIEEGLRYASRFVENKVTRMDIVWTAEKIEASVPVKVAFSDVKVSPELKLLLLTYDVDRLPDKLEELANSLYSKAYHSACTGVIFASTVLPVLLGAVIVLLVLGG